MAPFSIKGIFALLVLPASICYGQFGQWTPEVMSRFEKIEETAISNDGQYVAYTVAKPASVGTGSKYVSHIWVASADRKINRQFTAGQESCIHPSFSPDGKSLAFLSKRGQNDVSQIWVLPIAGGEAKKLTTAEKAVLAYAWAPDSRSIAFTTLDPDKRSEREQQKERGDMLVVDHNVKYAHLYTLSVQQDGLDENELRRLTVGPLHVASVFQNPPIVWTSDSQSIIFEHRGDPSIDSWSTTDISKVWLLTREIEPLVAWPGYDGQPALSQDGKMLAFASFGSELAGQNRMGIYTMPLTGGKPKRRCDLPAGPSWLLGWHNNRQLFFTARDSTSQRIFRLGLSGEPAVEYSTGAETFSRVTLNRSGNSLAFVAETPEEKPQVNITPTNKYLPHKVSAVNANFAGWRLARTELISWWSADSVKIEGLLTYPLNHFLDKLYPLVVALPDGPDDGFVQSFTASASTAPIQAFAAKGYAVLRINPRGSAGYLWNADDAWSPKLAEDVLSGVNKVVRMSVAHPDSLCILGWGYGGFITATTIVKSNRFKAACIGAGIVDLESHRGTTDRASFLNFPTSLTNGSKHRFSSPITEIYRSHTPTLILHGKEDRQVAISQSLELYNALKRNGVTAQLVIYPRTPHVVKEPKFMVDIGLRTLFWFDKHIGRKVPIDVIQKPN